MTEKQKTTLILFAQNYSLDVIAKKQEVSLATIRERIKSLSKNYPKEFNNAAGVRMAYKRNRIAIKRPQNFYDCYMDIEQNEIIQLF